MLNANRKNAYSESTAAVNTYAHHTTKNKEAVKLRTCIVCVFVFVASESDLQNKRLKLDYEEITPCLKEVTVVWEKMLGTPGRAKIKFDAETIHAAVAQGTYLAPQMHVSVPLGNVCSFSKSPGICKY